MFKSESNLLGIQFSNFTNRKGARPAKEDVTPFHGGFVASEPWSKIQDLVHVKLDLHYASKYAFRILK
jgi:hypothetical protein